MKNYIFCDPDLFSGKNVNNSLGNKLLHIFFVINLANKKNMKPVLPKNNIINQLFEINDKYLFNFDHKYTQQYIYKNIECKYRENSAFSYYNSKNIYEHYLKKILTKFNSKTKNLKLSIEQSRKQYHEARNFFETENINKNFYVKGHFFSYSLMPKKEVLFDYINIKKDMIDNLKKKFPDCENEDTLCIHFRATDYQGHLGEFFNKGIKLPKSYYINALEKINYKNFQKIYCLSDDLYEFREMLKDVKYFDKLHFVDNNSSIEDWLMIFLCKNIIQSNSSFCWTASLFNKVKTIQPSNGYNFYDNSANSSIPYDFIFKNSQTINFSS